MEGVDFANVSADVLASQGIALAEPKSSPSMAEVEAAAIAIKAAGGATVLESRYAYCTMVSKHPNIEQDCWAFSLDPTGRTSMFGGTPATYSLVLVDPVSGEVLLNQIGWPGTDASLLRRDPRLGPA
jgi:hypothetical protein